ncbi:MAG: tautomerase family protein [Deltaproteobacteria bacterium]|nr:tautomerase family protein [Deltaproteobacteria bacterium]
MPLIRLEIFEGRPDEMKNELIKRVTVINEKVAFLVSTRKVKITGNWIISC